MAQEDPGLQELVTDFVTESREHLGNVEADLLSLETRTDAFTDTVNRVFRAVHSVKGVAGFLGFEHINRLAHSLESVLDLVRKDRLEMSGGLADVLLTSIDRLRELVENVTDSNTMSIEDHLQRLQVYLEPKQDRAAAESAKASAAATPLAAADEWLLELSVNIASLAATHAVGAAEIVDMIARAGRVLEGGTELAARCAGDGPGRDPVAVVVATRSAPDQLCKALRLEAQDVRTRKEPVDSPPPSAPEPSGSARSEPRVVAAAPVAKPATAGDAANDKPRGEVARRAEPGADSHHDSIRVSVLLLDRLMNLSGELVLGRNQMLQARSVGNEKGLTDATARLNQVVSEMQEAIMQTRMQPIGTLFQRFPRVVRDLSGKLGKRCRLDIQGKDVDLDRSILEALSDPLTHLVRNSVDHGMELPEQRQKASKDPEGIVCLSASQQGGNVCIGISDDGRGIDATKLKAKAVEKGVITAEVAQAMSEREAVNLIFAPGFSTAEKVTDVSGRGVGMDVVRSNIERLGGHVDVQTAVGRGTKIEITIPLTLAILPAMVVSCGPRRYVLAQANVAELVRLRDGEGSARIVDMDGREVLRLRGSVLPLLRLRRVLGEQGDGDPASATIIVVETVNLRYGLVVDAPPDAEEIVVKPLGRHLKRRAEYSGATILGDGRVAMILDASGIAEAASLKPNERGGQVAAAEAGKSATDAAELVLFRNHPTETFAVPLGLVDRIQRVESKALVEVGARTVFAEGERVLPIVRLEGALRAKPADEASRVSVLVMRLGKQSFGVVASQIEDIRTVTVTFDDRTLAEQGVLGSFQLQERTVRMLDPTAVATKALPDLFVAPEPPPPPVQPRHVAPAAAVAGEAPAVPEPVRGPLRVLFAEDTKFFREHVAKTLRGAAFVVTAVGDGELAWQELEKPEAQFDLVVTDVQMPNCDGLELTRRIRRSPRWRNVPVVALTSLSSAEDEAAGRAAGITTYLVKLDDAALIAAVRQHAGAQA